MQGTSSRNRMRIHLLDDTWRKLLGTWTLEYQASPGPTTPHYQKKSAGWFKYEFQEERSRQNSKPIEFSFEAPTWSLGKSMAAHITMGRIGEVYHNDLKDTIYQICGRRDEQWEMICTRRDKSIAAYIQELNQHIRRQENQMCADMIDLKKAKTRIKNWRKNSRLHVKIMKRKSKY